MPDQFSAESAYLNGKAKFELWRQQFQMKWSAKDISAAINLTANSLNNLPEPQRSQLIAQDPQAWQSVERLVNRQKAGKNG